MGAGASLRLRGSEAAVDRQHHDLEVQPELRLSRFAVPTRRPRCRSARPSGAEIPAGSATLDARRIQSRKKAGAGEHDDLIACAGNRMRTSTPRRAASWTPKTSLVGHEIGRRDPDPLLRGVIAGGKRACRSPARRPVLRPQAEREAVPRRSAPARASSSAQGECRRPSSNLLGPQEICTHWHHRSLHLHVRIAPGQPILALEAEVFVADIMPADEGGAAIDDDDLAVIAEVELEAISASPLRVLKWRTGGITPAARSSSLKKAVRQIVAAEPRHRAGSNGRRAASLRDERVLEPPSQARRRG